MQNSKYLGVKKTKAAVLFELGKPLVICDLEIPPIMRGQVLVKVLYSGVCRSQLMEVSGSRGVDRWLPHMLGHEGAGVVMAVGEGVTKISPGDDVILGWIKGAGLEAPGARYKAGKEVLKSGQVTTFSNYAIVSENRVFKKPAGLPYDSAVLFGCALPTGAGMVLNEIRPSANHSVIILGLGGIGLSALITLIALGVKNLIALDISEEKLDLAKSFGVIRTLNALSANCADQVMEWTGGGADFCIESAGLTSTIELGFSLIKPYGGKLIFASHPPDGDLIRLRPHELISGKQISGSWGGKSNLDFDIQTIFELFSKARMSIGSLISRRYSLEQINEALEDLKYGRVFRPLIVMQHDENEAGC